MYAHSSFYLQIKQKRGETTKVADGIIAPGYEPAALEILKAKKGGKFIVLQAKADHEPPPGEYREVYGVGFYQDRNSVLFRAENLKVDTSISTITTTSLEVRFVEQWLYFVYRMYCSSLRLSGSPRNCMRPTSQMGTKTAPVG